MLLTGQDRRETVNVSDAGAMALSGEAGPREGAAQYLVEPWGLTPARMDRLRETAELASTAVAELEYWFETQDDQTETGRVLLVEPPAVVARRPRSRRPAYAVEGQDIKRVDLGSGNTERRFGPGAAGRVAGEGDDRAEQARATARGERRE